MALNFANMTRSKFLILLFFIALVSGFFWNQKIFGYKLTSDQRLYDFIAVDIIAKGQFTAQGQDTYAEPLYPFFLAGIYKVFGRSHDIVRIIQIVFFALMAVLIYLIAESLAGHKIAVWPALLTALFYGIANQAGLLLSENLFIFLIVLDVYIFNKALRQNNNILLAISGVLLGLATLTRGVVEFLFIFAVIVVFINYFRKISFAKIIAKCAVLVFCFALIVMPWILWGSSGNTVSSRAGRVLFSRAEWMEKLYTRYPAHFAGHFLGYYFSQKFDPNVKSSDFRELPEQDQKMRDFSAAGKSQKEINEILLAEAKQRILSSPHKYILMSILDFISLNSPIIPSGSFWQNTLTIHPMFAEGRRPEMPEWQKIMIILTLRFAWFLFFFFVALGIIRSVENWRSWIWILMVIFYFNLVYSALHAIPRYALPIYPFYFILFFVGLFQCLKHILKVFPLPSRTLGQ